MPRPPVLDAVARAVARILRAPALGCAALVSLSTAPGARADDAVAPRTAPRADAMPAIPAQPLDRALEAFAQASGTQIVYVADVSDIVRGKRSHALEAGLQPEPALARLLRGTGLRAEYLTPNLVRIVAPPVAPMRTSLAPATSSFSEVIVTARRVEESLYSVPISVAVLTGEQLSRLHVARFDDYVTAVPGVTAAGVGPGMSNIVIRGLSVVGGTQQGTVIYAMPPNVAVYVDEQPVGLANHNLDLFAVDLERVEILKGPQGTLFGAGAEAGVVRYVTRSPDVTASDVHAELGYAMTAHGAPSREASLVANWAAVPGRLALRATLYDERRGGYIDNVPAVFERQPGDIGIQLLFGGQVPPNSTVLDNAAVAGRDFNPSTFRGARLQLESAVDDDWQVLLSQSMQVVGTQGVFAEMASDSLGRPQPDLTVQQFTPSYSKDRFESTSLTVTGRVGPLDLLYSSTYHERRLSQSQDYTNYARGAYNNYYQCVNAGGSIETAQCFSPASFWHDEEIDRHVGHELRLSTPVDRRLRVVGGLYYEREAAQGETDWHYTTATDYFVPIAPPTGYWTLNGSLTNAQGFPVFALEPGATFVRGPASTRNAAARAPDVAFFNEITHLTTQRAAFASADVDLVPQVLTLTVGARWSQIRVREVGSSVGSFLCQKLWFPDLPDPCVDRGAINLDSMHLQRTFTNVSGHVGLAWKPVQNLLLYYSAADGFRAGGFNRSGRPGGASPLNEGFGTSYPFQAIAVAHGGWWPSQEYRPDRLVSHELGWKMHWLDRRIASSGALYQEDWRHVQTSSVSPTDFPTIVFNGGDYRVRGVETELALRPLPGLTLDLSASWMHSALVRKPPLLWRDGTPIDLSALQSALTGQPFSSRAQTLGTSLASAPPSQLHAVVRYEFPGLSRRPFVQLDFRRQSHSFTSIGLPSFDVLGQDTRYELPPFSIAGLATGVRGPDWSLDLYADNLGDVRAQLSANYAQFYKAVTVVRPRTVGVRFRYDLRGRPGP